MNQENRDMVVNQYMQPVQLTQQEINQAKARKNDLKKKDRTFANTGIYRSLHYAMSLMLQIIQQMPKKTVKASDIMLNKLAEATQWCASAYEQSEPLLKSHSLSEAIALIYVVKLLNSSAKSVKLVGENNSKQLGNAMDQIIRQLVAWRSSTNDRGDNGRN